MRVPRRGSVTTTPRRRSSASAGRDGDRAQPDLGGQAPDRGQPLPGRELARRRRPSRRSATSSAALPRRDPILFQISHDLYYDRSGGSQQLCAALAPRRPSRATDRVRLRRKRERGSYERATIDAILDEALIAHLGIADEHGQPFVIPTLHARDGDVVYCTARPRAARCARCATARPPA